MTGSIETFVKSAYKDLRVALDGVDDDEEEEEDGDDDQPEY